jgi:hypothetical protein
MAAVSPISDVLSAPYLSPLVLPPSGNTTALELTPTTNGQGVDSTQASTSAATTNATDGATGSSSVSNQPLNVVLDALTTAGLDSAINQEILGPSVGQPTGTLSTFIEELFTAITAQTVANQQSIKTADGTQATVASQTPAAAAVASAFAATAAAVAPNSALETQVQSLAQTVNAQAANPATATDADAATVATLAPLQESFDQLTAAAGGTASTANLGGFLDALAQNLHVVPSPLGNIVDSLI